MLEVVSWLPDWQRRIGGDLSDPFEANVPPSHCIIVNRSGDALVEQGGIHKFWGSELDSADESGGGAHLDVSKAMYHSMATWSHFFPNDGGEALPSSVQPVRPLAYGASI